MIRDFKGRPYMLLGVSLTHTVLECMTTKDVIIVANEHFTACGFID